MPIYLLPVSSNLTTTHLKKHGMLNSIELSLDLELRSRVTTIWSCLPDIFKDTSVNSYVLKLRTIFKNYYAGNAGQEELWGLGLDK